MIITEKSSPDLFRYITDRNLITQFDHLESLVGVALRIAQTGVSHEVIKSLNGLAAWSLWENPGEYRKCPIHITNTLHIPPPWRLVKNLQNDLVGYLRNNWSMDGIHLAAYALWRLNWIHPFEEGNGRTARAVCYYILCVKSKMWLPGKNTVPEQIRSNRQPYYAALRAADESLELGSLDISPMERYLEEILAKQLEATETDLTEMKSLPSQE